MLWTVLIITFAGVGLSWGLLQFEELVSTRWGYHIAGVSMLYQALAWVSVCTYAAWFSFKKQTRDIIWAGGISGSFLMGTIAVLSCTIPTSKILQTQIWLAGHTMVSIEGESVRIGGAISHDLDARIKDAVHGHVNRLLLGKNNGGMIAGVLKAQPVLKQLGVDEVLIDGRCASSCALLALMFPKRLMAPGGALGFHKLRPVAGNDDTSVASDTARVHARLTSLGYDSALVDHLFSTVDLNWYSAKEARSLGLVTGCWDPAEVKEVPCS
jgi:hypothetical protein